MRVLLVNPEFPESYWSGSHALPFANRRVLLPPLGLITVAALLPQDWEIRLSDLATQPVSDDELRWADVVMLGGMLVQRPSLHEVLGRCKRLGVRTVVGGPYATALPHELELADTVVAGEGEHVIPRLAQDLLAGSAQPLYREEGKPDLSSSPIPRYDLLKKNTYHHMALQYSRGCPFTCEFCDIIVMYGRNPRAKQTGQVIAELDAIRKTGFEGDVFFVDDNFIGNKKAVRELLPVIAEWRDTTSAPIEFYTEASINLADDTALIEAMTRAGFTAVFIGIETPSPEALRETKKLQNLKRDLVAQVHSILEGGLDVWAGFILGFDNDREDIFDRMVEFVQSAAIPYAMVGILAALPHTPLYARLEKEGRLRPEVGGDQFGLTNVVTKLSAATMVAGYRRVLQTLYHPETYFERCKANLARWTPKPGSRRRRSLADLAAALRALRGQGVSGPYRKAYWQFLRWVVRNHPEQLARALAQAAAGHHFITYTREVVLPRLLEQAQSHEVLSSDLAVADPVAP
jgi:radical SAM superfamily enzyme YgiQ (UPF0313 family)